MTPSPDHWCNCVTPIFTRRNFLRSISCGFGWLAFSSLFGRSASALAGSTGAPAASPLAPKIPPLHVARQNA